LPFFFPLGGIVVRDRVGDFIWLRLRLRGRDPRFFDGVLASDKCGGVEQYQLVAANAD
jgi:hypothetical protein